MDEVRHRAGGDRPERRHRARADDVGVDLRRAARVRRLPVVRGRRRSTSSARRSTKRASTSSRGSAGRRRARSRAPRSRRADAQSPTSQPASASASSSRAAYGAPEAPVMPRKTRIGAYVYFAPLEASRKAAICVSCSSSGCRRAPRRTRHHGVAELATGSRRSARSTRRRGRSRRSRSGRARRGSTSPTPRYVWHCEAADLREELRARDRRLVVGEALLLAPTRAPPRRPRSPSASFAVAPL